MYTAIVIVIIVLYIAATWNVSVADAYVGGYWIGDPHFCESSEVDSILLYIDEPVGAFRSRTRKAYIVITDDVTSQGLTLTYVRGWSSRPEKYTIRARAEFDEDQMWPEYVDITTDMTTGEMVIRGCDDPAVTYLRATKSHEVTNAARLLDTD